jgi:DNA-binding GntR family transcriptional regulator
MTDRSSALRADVLGGPSNGGGELPRCWSIMPRSNRSVEIEAEMLEQITSGRWHIGHCLGDHRGLSLAYKCSRSDMNRALYALRKLGLIEVRPGRLVNRTFVISNRITAP